LHYYDETKIPEVLRMTNGELCATAKDWEDIRRPEIMDMVTTNLYGRYPGKIEKIVYTICEHDAQACEGIAIYEKIQATCFGPVGKFTFPLHITRPRNKRRYGGIVHFSGSVTPEERERMKAQGHPVADRVEEKIVTSGYASIRFAANDLDPETGRENSILAIWEDDHSGDAGQTITAWSLGAIVAMEYMTSHPEFDLEKTVVVGHSRYGKTALWTGANDLRYKLVGVIQSGHGGAAMSRCTDGEHVANLSSSFGWTCENYKKFADHDDQLPFDGHTLLSMIAPRYLYVSCAREDYWCDPDAEFESIKRLAPVWELFGKKSISINEPPKDELPDHSGDVGYHYRHGNHGFSNYDWQCFLQFVREKLGE